MDGLSNCDPAIRLYGEGMSLDSTQPSRCSKLDVGAAENDHPCDAVRGK